MTTRTLRFLMLLSLLGLVQLHAQSGLEVQPDPENIVASRIAGKWRLDTEATTRLGATTNLGPDLEFRRDDTVVDKVPEKLAKKLEAFKIYLAGVMTLRGNEQPFLVTELKGNPHVIWFRERNGDPMGDAESFNVMLARGVKDQNDMLFTGGDFNNQPFAAYGRSRAPDATADKGMTPEVRLKAALADMTRLLSAKSYTEFIQTYADPKDLEKIAKEEGGLNKLAAQFGEQKATMLLKVIEQIKETDPTFNEDRTEATYQGADEARPMRLRLVENRWYIRN